MEEIDEKDKNVLFFEKSLNDFLNDIKCIKNTLNMVIPSSEIIHDSNVDDLLKFIQKNSKKSKNKIKDEGFYLDYNSHIEYKKLEDSLRISSNTLKIIPRSLFVSMISSFDVFISNIIKIIYIIYPEKLSSSEKNIGFSTLSEFNTIEEARDFIIEKEVESVLRNSHLDHFKYLEKILSVDLRKDLLIWNDFIEMTERRNLFVHNGGIVSREYLVKCKQSGIIVDKEVKIGSELETPQDYFNKSYECLFELSVKLTHVIWRKLLPNKIEKADESLNFICFELLQNESYNLADILLNFATETLKKYFNEVSKNMFIINKALSKKLAQKNDEALKIINTKDWSASSNIFKFAKAIISDDYKDAFLLMKIISKDEINEDAYRKWPLFKDFRTKDEFKDIYKSLFGNDFIVLEHCPPKLVLFSTTNVLGKVKKEIKKKKHITSQ